MLQCNDFLSSLSLKVSDSDIFLIVHFILLWIVIIYFQIFEINLKLCYVPWYSQIFLKFHNELGKYIFAEYFEMSFFSAQESHTMPTCFALIILNYGTMWRNKIRSNFMKVIKVIKENLHYLSIIIYTYKRKIIKENQNLKSIFQAQIVKHN